MENIAFTWERCLDDYEIIEEIFSDHRSVKLFRPKSARFESYHPLDFHPGLFRQFAALTPDPNDPAVFLDFANTWGLLMHARSDESPATWYAEHESMCVAIRACDEGQKNDLTNIFDRVSEVRPTLRIRSGVTVFEPDNLRDAMWIQLAMATARNQKFKICRYCQTWFPYGPGTGHRSTALYCSPKCQKAFSYQMSKGR